MQVCIKKVFIYFLINHHRYKIKILKLLFFYFLFYRSLAELQKCVVDELKNCGQPTPANIVESLFNFVCQTTPCKNFECNKVSAGVSLKSTLFVTVLGSFSILLGRINF